MNDNGIPIDIEDVMAGIGNSEAHRLAIEAMYSRDEAVRDKAAEMLLDKANEFTFWLDHILDAGFLKSRIKKEVAWPALISLQSKEPSFYRNVLGKLKARDLGTEALTGRNGRSGGRKSPGAARGDAKLIHEIISGIHQANILQGSKHHGSTHASELDVSMLDGFAGSIVRSIFMDHDATPWVEVIRTQASAKPSGKLWQAVGQTVLLYVRPDLKPEKQGRTKGKKTLAAVISTKLNRRIRTAIRNAYIDLANEEDKSRNY